MRSMQFCYFADKKGEEIVRKELLETLGSLLVMKYLSGTDNIVEDTVNFVSNFSERSLITSTDVKNYLTADENGHLNLFNNPVIEYKPSKIKDEGIYLEGRLAYFAGDKYPELKKIVQSLFRKLKKYCWKDKQWQIWVFETVGDEATVFIPNRIVSLKKQ